MTKLEFVDRERFKKGIDLDAVNQLVLVALKPGESVDTALVSKAINDAGYDPVHLYTLKGGTLQTKSLE